MAREFVKGYVLIDTISWEVYEWKDLRADIEAGVLEFFNVSVRRLLKRMLDVAKKFGEYDISKLLEDSGFREAYEKLKEYVIHELFKGKIRGYWFENENLVVKVGEYVLKEIPKFEQIFRDVIYDILYAEGIVFIPQSYENYETYVKILEAMR